MSLGAEELYRGERNGTSGDDPRREQRTYQEQARAGGDRERGRAIEKPPCVSAIDNGTVAPLVTAPMFSGTELPGVRVPFRSIS